MESNTAFEWRPKIRIACSQRDEHGVDFMADQRLRHEETWLTDGVSTDFGNLGASINRDDLVDEGAHIKADREKVGPCNPNAAVTIPACPQSCAN